MPKITNIKNANFIILVIACSTFVALLGRLFPQLPITIVRWIFTLILGTLLLQGINKWVVFIISIASLLGQILGHWDYIKSYLGIKQLIPIVIFIPIGCAILWEIYRAK